MKPSSQRSGSNQPWWRIACIACIPFVLSFIAFNLLDLDGSKLTKAFDRAITDADITTVTQSDPVPEPVEDFRHDRTLTLTDVSDAARNSLVERLAPTRLENARSHRYHVSLPRDSVPG